MNYVQRHRKSKPVTFIIFCNFNNHNSRNTPFYKIFLCNICAAFLTKNHRIKSSSSHDIFLEKASFFTAKIGKSLTNVHFLSINFLWGFTSGFEWGSARPTAMHRRGRSRNDMVKDWSLVIYIFLVWIFKLLTEQLYTIKQDWQHACNLTMGGLRATIVSGEGQ